MGDRSIWRRLRIVAENRRIARAGSYVLPNGDVVSLPGERLHTAVLCQEMQVSDPPVRRRPYVLEEHIIPTDTISAVLRFQGCGRVMALNFANAMVPGGAYRIGGQAQEESLCRSTLLYPALCRAKGFYANHWLHPTPLYSHRVLYSKNIPVIRSADGELLSVPCVCDFLTAAAVNRRLAMPWHTQERIHQVMRARIKAVLAAAMQHMPDVLILGAFGCGAFGNRREEILPMFAEAINCMIPDSVEVWFAIPDGL